MEIERKFLLRALPAGLAETRSREIVQGYLACSPDGVEVRIRRTGDEDFLTVKQGGGLSRLEVEIPLAAHDFATLWPLTVQCRLRKTRHDFPGADGLTIEVDLYADQLAGLQVAEVEFPSEDAAHAYQPPGYFGREITGDPAYRNQALARHGVPLV